MLARLEKRLVARMVSLTLRKSLFVIVGVAAVLAMVAAVLERLVDPAFDTFPQALWFSVTTVSTVGYGDYVPESTAGRFVAGVLMFTALGLIPLITSIVVSVLVAQQGREAREAELRDLTVILERLDSLDRKLTELGPAQPMREA